MPDMTDRDNLEITCPCCRTKLVVDRPTGEVLLEERPKKAGLSWDNAVSAGKSRQAEAETLFNRGMDRQANEDDILERKFREALERADTSDDPPPRIYDLD